jgi:CRP-like cAMP-binding protein
MNLTMFEKMQLLPLFQGLSFRELSEIVEWMKMDFYQFRSGDNLVNQGDKCTSITFVISGVVCAEYMDAKGRFVLSETLASPLVLEPYNIYGMHQSYTRTYWMKTDGGGLVIPKNVFNELLRRYQIIRTNFMNTICTRLQYHEKEMSNLAMLNIRGKILKTIMSVSCTSKGHKLLKIKMETLADIIGVTRLNVSRELNKMQQEQLINIRRGTIEIFKFEGLYHSVHNGI